MQGGNEIRRIGAGEGGFTLVELLVVMVIIALLTALGVSSFLSQRSKAQDSEAKQTLRTAAHAMQIFQQENDTYAATPADLETVEGSLRSARNLGVTGTQTTYDLSVDSASGRNTYTFSHQANGSVVRSCTAPGEGGCRSTPDETGSLW